MFPVVIVSPIIIVDVADVPRHKFVNNVVIFAVVLFKVVIVPVVEFNTVIVPVVELKVVIVPFSHVKDTSCNSSAVIDDMFTNPRYPVVEEEFIY